MASTPAYWLLGVTVVDAQNFSSAGRQVDAYCTLKYRSKVHEQQYSFVEHVPAALPCETMFSMPDRASDRLKITFWDRAKSRKIGGDARLGYVQLGTYKIAEDAWYPLLSEKTHKQKNGRQALIRMRCIRPTPQMMPGSSFSLEVVYDPADFEVADWGRVLHAHYSHHFVVLPGKNIIHFYGTLGEAVGRLLQDGICHTLRLAINGTILAGSLKRGRLDDMFADAQESGARVERIIVPESQRMPDELVVRTACNLLDNDENAIRELAASRGVSAEMALLYNVLTSNCESLACYLKTGEWRSFQVGVTWQAIIAKIGGRVEEAQRLVQEVENQFRRDPQKGIASTVIRTLIASRSPSPVPIMPLPLALQSHTSFSPPPASPRGMPNATEDDAVRTHQESWKTVRQHSGATMIGALHVLAAPERASANGHGVLHGRRVSSEPCERGLKWTPAVPRLHNSDASSSLCSCPSENSTEDSEDPANEGFEVNSPCTPRSSAHRDLLSPPPQTEHT